MRATRHRELKSPHGAILFPVKQTMVLAATRSVLDTPRTRSETSPDVSIASMVGEETEAPAAMLSKHKNGKPSLK